MISMNSLSIIVLCVSLVTKNACSFILRVSRPFKVSTNRFLLHSTRKSDVDMNPSSTQQNWDLGGTFENYSNSLSMTPTQQKQNVDDELAVYNDAQNKRGTLLQIVHQVSKYSFLPKKTKKKGTLIFVRGGESEFSQKFLFTGWLNPDITSIGVEQMEHAARLILENGYEPDVIYTSRLKRAIHSTWVLQRELACHYLPVYHSWRLNERHYGALQGLSKKETAERLGQNVVQAWRRSLKARPPPMLKTDQNYAGFDSKYKDLLPDQIPLSESLLDCMERTCPLWEFRIRNDLEQGKTVMVVGHANSLRGLAKLIDNIGDDAVANVSFPKGSPFVYHFGPDIKPIKPKEGSIVQAHTSGFFLEKALAFEMALRDQKKSDERVPGTFETLIPSVTKRMTTLEKSLFKLRDEQALIRKMDHNDVSSKKAGIADSDTDSERFDEERFDDFEVDSHVDDPSFLREQPTVNVNQVDVQKDPVVVLIRHGRTPHNKLALFTGWEDPPLAKEGIEDAKVAGRLLKQNGFEFDVVYTSWLNRAIETAWYVLDEMDLQWVPIIKSWRLNERHYGALTGKSKKMVGNTYGEDQLKRWRRGYTIRPPPASSYSSSYPGNDSRRTKYVSDLRVSVSETLLRSFEEKRFVLHRKFPKSESLKDCMDRSIPFYTQRIIPEAVAKKKRVLITSHENAIRGILMHLCDIPPESMNDLHLPNGLPLVYNVRRKCISLLDDGSGKDPLQQYDFGSASKYLFRPCILDDDDLA